MFANYLELIRNVKLAISNKWTNKEITTFFFISEYKLAIISKYKWNIKQINLLILKIHDIEYKLKSGKYFKNLVIDSFFLNICDIII